MECALGLAIGSSDPTVSPSFAMTSCTALCGTRSRRRRAAEGLKSIPRASPALARGTPVQKCLTPPGPNENVPELELSDKLGHGLSPRQWPAQIP
jgi:hypothetical protein